MTLGLIIVLFLVLAAEFTNGLSDAANAIATVVGTRVLTPAKAVVMAAVLNLVGVLVTGSAVAATIGKGVVRSDAITLETLAAAMLTVVVWTMAAWFFGIPTSETHELLAGLAGAGLATAGPSVLLWDGWRKVLIGLGVSTLVGFGLAFLLMTLIYWGFRRVSRSAFHADSSAGYRSFRPPSWPSATAATTARSSWGSSPLALVAGGAAGHLPGAGVGDAALRRRHGPRHRPGRLAHHQDHGQQGDPPGARRRASPPRPPPAPPSSWPPVSGSP